MSEAEAQRFGPYRAEKLLGRGAMGVVFSGVDERDSTPVAVKVIARDLLAAADMRTVLDRFRREAEIGMRLDHPGIVRVLGWGEAGETLYLAMELVRGRELAEVMAAEPAPSPHDAVRYIAQLLAALGYAHAQGILHRDVKPANVLVEGGGRLRLMDFGIARIQDSDLTRSGEVLGTPSHMAPEQVLGEPLDERTDLFSAGVILYTMLAGRRPFNGAAAAVMFQVLHLEPAPPSTRNPACPKALDEVVARAMAKRPADRFADAAAFADALERAAAELAPAELAEASDPDGPDATRLMPGRAPDGAAATVLAGAGRDTPRDAERLAGLLRACIAGTVTERRLNQATSLLGALTGAKALDPAGADSLRRVIDDALPALVQRILTHYPAPGRTSQPPRADWIASVRLLALLRQAAGRLGAGDAAQAAGTQVASQLLGVFLGYSSTLSGLLFAEDDPDVMAISMDLMRLDVLQHGLDELGAATESRYARDALCTFAGQIMAKASAIVGTYLAHRDELARFGVANLLVALEELITMAERLFESSDAAPTPPAQLTGQAVVRDFADKVGQLVELVVAELEPEVGREGAGAAEFAHRLEQVGLIYAFATRVRDPSAGEVTAALVARVRGAVERLTERLSLALRAEPDEAAFDGRIAITQMNALLELAERFGWQGLRDRLLLILRATLVARPELIEQGADDLTLRHLPG